MLMGLVGCGRFVSGRLYRHQPLDKCQTDSTSVLLPLCFKMPDTDDAEAVLGVSGYLMRRISFEDIDYRHVVFLYRLGLDFLVELSRVL